jgi:hypothetical protein
MKERTVKRESARGEARGARWNAVEHTVRTEALKTERAAGADARLLTKQEMADRLQVDLRTVERWMAMGVLQPLRILGVVRFDWAEELQRLKARSQEEGGNGGAKGEGGKVKGQGAEHRTSNSERPTPDGATGRGHA